MWKKNKKHKAARQAAIVLESLESRELFWSWGCVPPPTETMTLG
jgi:hypothetical protein